MTHSLCIRHSRKPMSIPFGTEYPWWMRYKSDRIYSFLEHWSFQNLKPRPPPPGSIETSKGYFLPFWPFLTPSGRWSMYFTPSSETFLSWDNPSFLGNIKKIPKTTVKINHLFTIPSFRLDFYNFTKASNLASFYTPFNPFASLLGFFEKIVA